MSVILEGVSKSYKDTTALNNVTLEISKGVFGILGPNGAGKTTLMKILTCLLRCDSGSITIDGVDIEDHKEIRKIVSYLPQEFSFYPKMTVYEAMDYMALLSGHKSKKVRKDVINDLMSKLNLKRYSKKMFKELSGGTKRRLGIAISLLKNPKVLIVDEPTVGLDPEERVNFRNLLMEYAIDRTVILSTHIVEDIDETCKNIAVIVDGNIVFSGKKTEFINKAMGKVRLLDVKAEKLLEAKLKYNVITIKENDDGYILKIISDEDIGKSVDPTLEDSYLVEIKSKEV